MHKVFTDSFQTTWIGSDNSELKLAERLGSSSFSTTTFEFNYGNSYNMQKFLLQNPVNHSRIYPYEHVQLIHRICGSQRGLRACISGRSYMEKNLFKHCVGCSTNTPDVQGKVIRVGGRSQSYFIRYLFSLVKLH